MERGLKGWTTKAASSGARLIWAREFSPQPFTFTFGTSTFTSILSGLALHGDVAAYKTILAVDDGRTEATNARKQPARARGPRPATKCVRAPANTPSPLRISAVPLASQIRTGKRHTQKNACKQVLFFQRPRPTGKRPPSPLLRPRPNARSRPTLSVRREREGAAESFGACRARDGALRREAAAAAAAASRAHTLAARACIRSLFFGPSSPTQEVLCTASPGIIVASSAPPWQQISTGSLTCHTWH